MDTVFEARRQRRATLLAIVAAGSLLIGVPLMIVAPMLGSLVGGALGFPVTGIVGGTVLFWWVAYRLGRWANDRWFAEPPRQDGATTVEQPTTGMPIDTL